MPRSLLSELWIKKAGPTFDAPNWTNAPRHPVNNYSGGFPLLQISDEILQISTDLRWARWFVPRFMAVFACLVTGIVLFLKPDPLGLAVVFFFLCCSVAVFSIAYSVIEADYQAGPYLIINRQTQTLELPRLKIKLHIGDVQKFQWIRGRTNSYNNDTNTDLNLLAFDTTGQLMRYHIMGAPSRRHVEQLVEFSRIPLEERDLGWRGYRNADINTLTD